MNRPDAGPALIAGVSLVTAAIFVVAIPYHVFDYYRLVCVACSFEPATF